MRKRNIENGAKAITIKEKPNGENCDVLEMKPKHVKGITITARRMEENL